jgi:hypothetical protein
LLLIVEAGAVNRERAKLRLQSKGEF